MRIDANSWYYSPDHGQLCQVIEAQTLWGETTCRVWLPGRDSVVRIPASRLKSLESAGTGSPDDIAYIAAAARVADALTQDVLLAPIESSVIPLPHQIRALSRAIANDRVRYLLADEVGLGKTIEAGLILRELKLRGLVKRTLVISPKGLVSQWVSASNHSQSEKCSPTKGRFWRKLRKSSSPVLKRPETAQTRTTMSAGSGKRYDKPAPDVPFSPADPRIRNPGGPSRPMSPGRDSGSSRTLPSEVSRTDALRSAGR